MSIKKQMQPVKSQRFLGTEVLFKKCWKALPLRRVGNFPFMPKRFLSKTHHVDVVRKYLWMWKCVCAKTKCGNFTHTACGQRLIPPMHGQKKIGANFGSADMWRSCKGLEQKLAWFGFGAQTMSVMSKKLVQGGCGEDIVGSVEHCCQKRPTPALSSHCGMLLHTLPVGMPDPEMQRQVQL
jgi:hypothetical protein